MLSDYATCLETVRAHHPLVHNITNYVVMNLTANALLAVGASPVMAHAIAEVEEMVGLAQALVINIGTLSDDWIVAMQKAVTSARDRGVPYILDPVGAGATQLRTRTAQELLAVAPPAVIRGNASEICAVAQATVKTRGVDSTLAVEAALDAARNLAQQFGTTVVISGPVDHIISAEQWVEVQNGDRLMAQVTGMGCTATALMGAFVGATGAASPLTAAVATMATMGVAGELARQQAPGPGTFVPHFIDALANLTPVDLEAQARLVPHEP
ncbi:MAG: hydroxyethylthiazole kinase [Cyanobacteria bacterium P01_D01_bin.115]